MGRTALFDRDALAKLLAWQDGVVTRRQLEQRGVTDAVIRHRIRPDGPWRVLLPGVFAATTGQPTALQREIAAVLYGGPECAITGPAALAAHRLPAPRDSEQLIDVLIPADHRRSDYAFVRVHRTTKMPAKIYPVGLVRYAPPARAVADTARLLNDLASARAVVSGAVQVGRVSVAGLAAELTTGSRAGSAVLRAVLAEVAEGVRSSAEGDLRTLVKRYRLPDPLYNPDLYLSGEFLARPDAWWPLAGVAVEVDSREWHLSPGDWERTMARHAKMSACGIIVLHYPPSRLRREPKVVAAEIETTLANAAGRQLHPALRTEPAR